MKRTGTSKKPLQRGEQLQPRIEADLLAIQQNPNSSDHPSKHQVFPNIIDKSVIFAAVYSLAPLHDNQTITNADALDVW